MLQVSGTVFMTLSAEQATLIGFCVTTLVALVAAVIDFRRFRVPNKLTFPLCLSGLVFHATVGGLPGLQHSVGGIGFGFAILLVFYITGVMGAGDVKLLAAVGAWIGGANTLYVFCVAGIVTGIHSLAALAWQRRLHVVPTVFQVCLVQMMTLGSHITRSDVGSLAEVTQRDDHRRYVMPFAVMIAIGVVLVAVREFAT
jgi:prepilin peptidase CpaA